MDDDELDLDPREGEWKGYYVAAGITMLMLGLLGGALIVGVKALFS